MGDGSIGLRCIRFGILYSSVLPRQAISHPELRLDEGGVDSLKTAHLLGISSIRSPFNGAWGPIRLLGITSICRLYTV
ncbi:hypothetical protein CBM2629_B120143 [Cupriavidus taiwanensis]|nr:hypothetical protein CBM2629_B120143 [Cupriavidus taiwanensis]